MNYYYIEINLGTFSKRSGFGLILKAVIMGVLLIIHDLWYSK
jgi:hypothetical protein